MWCRQLCLSPLIYFQTKKIYFCGGRFKSRHQRLLCHDRLGTKRPGSWGTSYSGDLVGEGQIQYVKETEVEAIKSVFKEMGIQGDGLQFAFIIVSKRISHKFFQVNNGAPPQNPPSGSVVDDVVTMPERYDFLLVSQSVRQGTVNPTSYNIIENSTKFTPEHFQRLTVRCPP